MTLPQPSTVIRVMAGFGLATATFYARDGAWLAAAATAVAVVLALFVAKRMEDQGQ